MSLVIDPYRFAGGAPPTQFFTDFSEYTVDAALPDWTNRWHSITSLTCRNDGTNNYAELISPGDRTALTWDAVSSVEDVEIFIEVYTISGGVAAYGRARVTGDSSSEQSIDSSVNESASNDSLRVTQYASGTFTTRVTTSNAPRWAAGVKVSIRHRLEGSNVYSKAWLSSDSEPGSWDLTTTTTVTGSGLVGFGGGGANTYRVYKFGVDIAGGTAPSS